MEDISFPLDSQEEMVRILKEKVRHLELQNKQLRKNQRSLSPVQADESNTKEQKQSKNMSMSDESNEKSSKESSLEDLCIIDIHEEPEVDDETWLVRPTAGQSSGEPAQSTHEWLRGGGNVSSSKELLNTQISLVSKLDEISQCSSRTFDSRTFTRPRRRRPALDWEALPTICAVENGATNQDVQMPVLPGTQVDVGEDCDMPPKRIVPQPLDWSTQPSLPPAPVNVHEIARLQEESLRLSSPMSSPKRGHVGTTRSNITSQEHFPEKDNQDPNHSVAHSSDGEAIERVRTPTLPVPRPSEEQSPSPGSSPFGSNSSLHRIPQLPSKGGATRRSLPNLSRVLNGLGTRSPAGHQSKQLQQPSPRSRLVPPSQHEVPSRSALPVPMSAPSRSRSSSLAGALSLAPMGAAASTSDARARVPSGRRSLDTSRRQTPESISRMPLPSRLAAAPSSPPSALPQPVRSGLPRPSRIPPPSKKRF